MKYLIFFVILIAVTQDAFANNTNTKPTSNKELPKTTIPFIVDNSASSINYKHIAPQASSGDNADNIGAQLKELAAVNLKEVIRTFKEDICHVNKGGAFEITIRVDASGKILGIGASADSGLKINIVCEQDKKR